MPWILLVIPVPFTQLTLWSTHFSYKAPIEVEFRMSGSAMATNEDGSLQPVAFDLSCDDVFGGRGTENIPTNLRSGLESLDVQCQEALDREQQQRREMLDRMVLPGSLTYELRTIHGFAVILIAVITASIVGTEFSWGTLRAVLSRGAGRWQLLSAKLLLAGLLAGAALAIISVALAGSSVVVDTLVSDQPETATEWAEVAGPFGRAWFGLLPYIALAGLVAVLASSSAAAISTVVAYFFTEWIVAGLLVSQFDWAQNVADFMMGRNITAWLVGGGHEGLEITLGTSTPVGDFPGLLHAFLVLAAYVIAMSGLTFWVFQRRDVGGASGG